MAGFRSFRRVAIISVLLLAALVGSTHASDDFCKETGIKVQDSRFLIVPDADGISSQWTLSGYALVADPDKLSTMLTYDLCSAGIGDNFRVNKVAVCREFFLLRGGDTVKRDGNGIDFSFSRRIYNQGPAIELSQKSDDRVCSDRFIVEVRPGAHRHFLNISGLPKSLSEDRVEFEIPAGVDAKDLSVQIHVGSERNFKSPTSWLEPIKGIHLQRLGRALLLSLLVALLLAFLERTHPFPSGFGPVSSYLRSPVTAALAFYMTGALTECARNIASVILTPNLVNSGIPTKDWIRDIIFRIGSEFHSLLPFVYPMIELALLGAILVTAFLARLLFALPAYAFGTPGRVMEFPFRVMLWAAVIAVAGAVFAMLILLVESAVPWLGFELPALVVSLLCALIGVGALRHVFDLSAGRVVAIAAIVAIVVLFPTDAVIKTSGEPRFGDNARAWAIFLSSFMAIFIYVAALTGFAFRVAGSDECKDRVAGQWLIFLLILLVATFSIAHPTNALAVAGLMWISSRLLLPSPAPPDEAALGRDAGIDWESKEETFPFIVGGVAALIFLIQFAFAASDGDFNQRFALLDLANVPRTFALGAVAGLVLARVGPLLSGDSATLKAANISAVVLVASVAAALVTLKGHFVAALTANFGVIASLIVCALVVYDLPSARNSEGRLEWREMFKGTTLAHGVPFLSAMAVALFSALSPIFMHELTNSVGTALRATLSQVQSSEDARKAQQSSEDAKSQLSPAARPQNQGGN
jgi:hypothetical protein